MAKEQNKMTKAQLIAAINNKEARVFARLRFGMTALAQVEQQKKTILATLKEQADDALFGANVSKKGHVYIYGVTLDEAKELGEVDAKVGTKAKAAEEQTEAQAQ